MLLEGLLIVATLGEAQAKLQELAERKPEAMKKAIAVAQAQGWKPTNRVEHFTKGTMSRIRFIAQEYLASGEGEMLIWDWDDGNEETGEGTVWVRSYATNNEVLFDIQVSGADVDITFYEGIDGVVNQAIGAPAPVMIGLLQRDGHHCNTRGITTQLDCMRRAAGYHFRNGVYSAIGGGLWDGFRAGGGWRNGLSAGIRGGGHGFVGGVISSVLFGTDFECNKEAQTVYYSCIADLEECQRTRQGCRF